MSFILPSPAVTSLIKNSPSPKGGPQLGQAEVRGVSHGSLSSNCKVAMLRIETARDIDQNLTAL